MAQREIIMNKHIDTQNDATIAEQENMNNSQHLRRNSRFKRFMYRVLAVVGIITTSTAVISCTGAHKWKDANVEEKVEFISEHLVDSVDASDQQATEIKDIIEKFAPSFTLMHANLEDHKATILSIFKQENVNEADLESARLAMFELLNQDSIQLTKMIAEIANVLTLEQRMVLIEKIEKRHHRHHF